MPGVIARPPLPPGPFLVVGLARSGVAAALALRALRGRGGRASTPAPVPDARRAELEAAGVPVHAGTPGTELLAGVETVVKSPGVPAAGAGRSPRRARPGIGVIGELELGWRLLPNETIAVTGSNGKTTTVELIGHLHRDRGAAGGGGRQRRHGADLALPAPACPRRGRRVPRRRRSSSRTRCASRPTPACCSTSPRTTSTATGRSTPTRPPSSRCSPASRPARSRSRRRSSPPTSAARRERVAVRRPARRRRAARRPRRRPVVGRRAAASTHDEIRLRGAHNRENAMAAAAVVPRPRHARATRCARGWRRSPASRTGSRRSPPTTACSTSTTPRRPTSPPRSRASSRSTGGLHLILGGSRKAGGYAPLAGPVAERARAVYLIGETGPEIGAALAGTGVPLHDAAISRRAVAAARAAARPGEVVLLSPACASFDQYRDFEERGEHFRALVA